MWCVIYNSRALSRFKFSHLRVKAPQIFDTSSQKIEEKKTKGEEEMHTIVSRVRNWEEERIDS